MQDLKQMIIANWKIKRKKKDKEELIAELNSILSKLKEELFEGDKTR